MRRVLFLLAAVAATVAAAWWVAHLPGRVSLSGFGYSIEAATPVAVVGGAVALLLLMLVLRLLLALLGLPSAFRFWSRGRQRRTGDAAVGRALVALAAGDGAAARRAAERARAALGDTPQTLLLAAESARLSGRLDEAKTLHEALAARSDGAFLGLRGLFRLAMDRRDWTEATSLARRAEVLQPGAGWLRDDRLRLAEETGNWTQALPLAGPDLPAEQIATAAALGEADPQAAARLARQAWKANPAFPPAVLAHAGALRRAGRDAAAEEAIVDAWRAAPHPDLAAAFLAEQPPEPKARLAAAVKLSNAHAEHVETQYLLARLSLEAGDLREATFHAGRARDMAPPTRRIFLLLADLAVAEGREPTALLREAAQAGDDPSWQCGQCGARHRQWHPACPACHAPGKVAWAMPGARALLEAK